MHADLNTIPLYNWGSSQANIDHYGKSTPPLVDVSKITVPSAFFVAKKDPLGEPTDAYTASLKMGSNIKHFEYIEGGHITFLVGKDTSYVGRVINLIKQYGVESPEEPKESSQE